MIDTPTLLLGVIVLVVLLARFVGRRMVVRLAVMSMLLALTEWYVQEHPIHGGLGMVSLVYFLVALSSYVLAWWLVG